MKAVAGLALVLGLVVIPAAAQTAPKYEMPPPPAKVNAAAYQKYEAPWRAHLLKVREAMRIEDPLQRCLAWPDLPDTHWPEGHAAAHCRNHHDPLMASLDLGWLEARVNAGDLAGLNAALDAQLARHFQPEPQFHEAIHYIFDTIRADERSNELRTRWLRLAPEDAYALLARASYYRRMAWKARGGGFAGETPSAQMARMSALVERAMPLYRKAIALNPRLMPAYEGMLNLAKADSLDAVGEEAFAGANAIDPACPTIAKEHMNALLPRWGGSYEQMEAYAATLRPLLAKRPLLALHVAAAYADMGNVLMRGKTADADRAALEADEKAIDASSEEDVLQEAASIALNPRIDMPGDKGKSQAYLLQVERFRPTPAWSRYWLAYVFVQDEPAIALRYADALVAADPANSGYRYMLAGSLYNTRQPEAADYHYRILMEDAEYRLTSLRRSGGDVDFQPVDFQRGGDHPRRPAPCHAGARIPQGRPCRIPAPAGEDAPHRPRGKRRCRTRAGQRRPGRPVAARAGAEDARRCAPHPEDPLIWNRRRAPAAEEEHAEDRRRRWCRPQR